MSSLIFIALALSSTAQAQYTATYSYNPANPTGLPAISQEGQAGTNQCGTGSSQSSLCQNVFLNGITDFCLWAPPYSDGKNATVAETERIEVAYCLKSGYGTRLFPDGTITGAHWVQTPDYVQVTGIGDFTKIGIPAGDAGGELDPHGADGNGNPVGGLVFGNSFGGSMRQYHEWTNFMSDKEFCIRACIDSGPNPANLCNHIYDTQGCGFNMPANYDDGYFESCEGDSDLPMGQNGGIAASSKCLRVASLTSFAPASTSGALSTSISVGVSGSSTFSFLFTGGPSTTTPTPSASKTVLTAQTTTSTKSKNSGSSTTGSPYAAAFVALAAGLPILLL